VIWICTKCHCKEGCRLAARSNQLKKAQKTYLGRLKGKLSRANAANKYRKKKAKGFAPGELAKASRKIDLGQLGWKHQR
jgi:hypothetical protein